MPVRASEDEDPRGAERLPMRGGIRRTARAIPSEARGSAPPDDQEESVDLVSYWAIVRRRWRVVLGTFAVVFLGVAIGTQLQEPVYRATGIIEIRKAAEGPTGGVASQLPRIADQYLETEYEILRSPALARRVLSDLSSPAPAAVPAGDPAVAQALVASPDAGGDDDAGGAGAPTTVEALHENLGIEPIRGSRLVRVHFDASDPELAARVVNSVIARYTDMRVDAALAAEAQLAAQVDSVRSQLVLSEQRLHEYVRGSGLVILESGGESENIVHERLRRLQEELTLAEADRYDKQSRTNLIRQRGVEHLGSDVLRSLSTRVADLRIEYARLRSTFTDEYPRTQQVKNQLDELERLLQAERARVAAEISGESAAAGARYAMLLEAYNEQRALVDHLAGQAAEYNAQKREVEAQQALFALLQQKQKEAGVSAAMASTEVGVVNPAAVPELPIRPAPAKNMKLAAVLGMVLGLGMAFLREATDRTVRTADEVDALSDRPVLALIPASGSIRQDQRSAAMAEAFAVLRTSILWNAGPQAPRSLLVTSAQPEEGKTTVSTSLACSLAAIGHRVLLVDADTRRPAVHTVLRLPPGAGLVDYLSGAADWHALVQPSRIAGLDVLPSGDPPEKPVDLLASTRMRELMDEAHTEYDFVIVDSPAVFINAADARILAPLVDGVVLVIRSGVTPREITSRVLRIVPRVMGVVLNGLDFRQFPAYYGKYSAQKNGGDPPRRLPRQMQA